MHDIRAVVDVAAPGSRYPPSEREIRDKFGSCGRILEIYPWNAHNTDKLHHFIVFHDEQSAQASLGRFRGMFHVSSLRPDPILRDRFFDVVSRRTGRRGRSVTVYDLRRDSTYGSTHRRIPTGPKNRGSSPIRSSQTCQLPPLRWSSSLAGGGARFAPASEPHRPSLPSPPPPSIKSSSGSTAENTVWSFPEDDKSISSSKPGSPIAEPNDSGTSQATTVLEGGNPSSKEKVIPSEMEDLPEAASEAVTLLRRAEDRAAWMMTAVKYRRQGKLREAEQIMAGFIDWMTEVGDDFELKPVFLFLSMLHADEAKAAAAGLTPSEALQNSEILISQKTAARYASIAHNMDGSAFQSLKRFVIQRDPTAEKENIDPKSIPSSNPLPAPPSRNDQSSRNFQPTEHPEISYLRRVKRRLEDDYVEERSVRRRLEGSLDETRDRLSRANKLLDYKQSQVRAEVEARRKTEQELEEVRKISAGREEGIRQEASRKLLLDLASQLTQSANTRSFASMHIG